MEVWGRGTNRVITMCREAGIAPPEFEEITGAAVVTFKVNVLGQGREIGQAVQQVTVQVTVQVTAQVTEFCRTPRSAREIMAELGLRHWKTFQNNYLLPLMKAGVLERTIPDKPRSRLQRYRTTPAERYTSTARKK